MSVALNTSYSLLSAVELQDGILKTTNYLRMMGVFVSIELWMLRRADHVPTLFPTQLYVLTAFCGCEHVSLWGACTLSLSYSLLSLAFTTWWNQKHPSYISHWLFYKSIVAKVWRPWRPSELGSLLYSSKSNWDILEV